MLHSLLYSVTAPTTMTSIETSFEESSFLDISAEVIVDDNNNEAGEDIPITSTPVATEKKVYKCVSCPYNTKSRAIFFAIDTRKTKHQKKKYQSSHWDKNYATSCDLRTHISAIHCNNPLMCELCSLRFNSRGSFKKHCVMKHYDVCKFVCDTCGRKYYDRGRTLGT